MKTTTAQHHNLLDLAAHSYDLTDDAVIALATADHHAGPALRLHPATPTTPTATATHLATLLNSRHITQAAIIFTGTQAHPPTARRITQVARRHLTVTTALRYDGTHWHDLDTEALAVWAPGQSNIGLTLAVHAGAPPTTPPLPAPAPAPHSPLAAATAAILDHPDRSDAEHLHAAHLAALDVLREHWPAALNTPRTLTDARTAQLLLALNTPLLITHTHAPALLFPPAKGPAPHMSQIQAGMPQGPEWATLAASETLLRHLITQGPDYASPGPLAALAYASWLRGRGSAAADLIDTGMDIARRHHQIALAAQLIPLREHLAHLAACTQDPGTSARP